MFKAGLGYPAITIPNLENRFKAGLGYPATTVPNLENRFKAGLENSATTVTNIKNRFKAGLIELIKKVKTALKKTTEIVPQCSTGVLKYIKRSI